MLEGQGDNFRVCSNSPGKREEKPEVEQCW